jgi:hypothetical protein
MKALLTVLGVLVLSGCAPENVYAQEPIPVVIGGYSYIYVMPPIVIYVHPWRYHRPPMQRIWMRPISPPRNYVQLPKYQQRDRVVPNRIQPRERQQTRPTVREHTRREVRREMPRLERRTPPRKSGPPQQNRQQRRK